MSLPGLIQQLDGGFWGLLGVLAALGYRALGRVPKTRRWKGTLAYLGFLIILVVAGLYFAIRSPSAETSRRSSSLHPTLALARGSTATQDPVGWLYVGVADKTRGALATGQAYVDVIRQGAVAPPQTVPQMGDRVKLKQDSAIYDRPPEFSFVRLRWERGAVLATMRGEALLDVVQNCTILSNSEMWCPVRV